MKTRMNLLPLCTSNVCPTNSGMIVHARAQVFRGCLARFSLSLETLRNSFSLTKGPFFALLLIYQLPVVSCQLPVSFKYSRSAVAAGIFRTCDDAESVSQSFYADYA